MSLVEVNIENILHVNYSQFISGSFNAYLSNSNIHLTRYYSFGKIDCMFRLLSDTKITRQKMCQKIKPIFVASQ